MVSRSHVNGYELEKIKSSSGMEGKPKDGRAGGKKGGAIARDSFPVRDDPSEVGIDCPLVATIRIVVTNLPLDVIEEEVVVKHGGNSLTEHGLHQSSDWLVSEDIPFRFNIVSRDHVSRGQGLFQLYITPSA